MPTPASAMAAEPTRPLRHSGENEGRWEADRNLLRPSPNCGRFSGFRAGLAASPRQVPGTLPSPILLDLDAAARRRGVHEGHRRPRGRHSSTTAPAADPRSRVRRSRRRRLGFWRGRIKLGENRCQRCQPRCEQETIVLDYVPEMRSQRVSFVVSEVQGSCSTMWDHSGSFPPLQTAAQFPNSERRTVRREALKLADREKPPNGASCPVSSHSGPPGVRLCWVDCRRSRRSSQTTRVA